MTHERPLGEIVFGQPFETPRPHPPQALLPSRLPPAASPSPEQEPTEIDQLRAENARLNATLETLMATLERRIAFEAAVELQYELEEQHLILPRRCLVFHKYQAMHATSIKSALEDLEATRSHDAAHDVILALYWRLMLLKEQWKFVCEQQLAAIQKEVTADAREPA